MANYKTKNKIGRQKLKKPLLKRLIIRFDFTSVVDMQKALNKIVAFLKPPKGFFNSFNQMSLVPNTTVGEEQSVKRSADVSPDVYRFSDCNIEPKQEVLLDFTRNSLCLDIRCNDQYDGIDNYFKIMTKIMSIIIENEDYVQLNRIGIRKIDGVDEMSLKEADTTFEYFNQRLDWGNNDRMISQQYTDQMFCQDILAFVIYNRIVRLVPETGNYRFTLDMDCYKEVGQLERRPSKEWLRTVLDEMNDRLFHMFKMGITLEYLNNNL